MLNPSTRKSNSGSAAQSIVFTKARPDDLRTEIQAPRKCWPQQEV
jgi:hypothetical protein